MDTGAIKKQLKALSVDDTRRSKMGRVREVWADIEQALNSGVPLTAVAETLRVGGLDVTDGQLKTYLYRLRRKQQKPSTQRTEAPKTSQAPAPATEAPPPTSGSHDPAALDSIINSKPDMTALARAGKQGKGSPK